MASHTVTAISSSLIMPLNSSQSFLRPSDLPLQIPPQSNPTHRNPILKFPTTRTRATVDGGEQSATAAPMLVQEPPQPTKEVEESVKLLKKAAKTRRVAKEEVLSALSVIEKGKLAPSGFLNTLGGTESPGRTWMLIFTAEKELKGGRYFPITAVQRFDAAWIFWQQWVLSPCFIYVLKDDKGLRNWFFAVHKNWNFLMDRIIPKEQQKRLREAPITVTSPILKSANSESESFQSLEALV